LPRCEQRERDRDQRIDFLVGAWMGNAAMIIGSDVIVYSWNPDADRDFLRDVLNLSHVDAGGGWLILGYRHRRSPYIQRTAWTSMSSI
jgi:hypothetical protein